MFWYTITDVSEKVLTCSLWRWRKNNLRNVVRFTPHYTASLSIRQYFSYLPPWGPQICFSVIYRVFFLSRTCEHCRYHFLCDEVAMLRDAKRWNTVHCDIFTVSLRSYLIIHFIISANLLVNAKSLKESACRVLLMKHGVFLHCHIQLRVTDSFPVRLSSLRNDKIFPTWNKSPYEWQSCRKNFALQLVSVAQLVEAPRMKPKGRGIVSRWGLSDFLLA